MALTGELRVKFTAKQTSVLDLGTSSFPASLEKVIALTSGTTANKADLLFSGTRTITASSSETLDLAGSLTDAFGATVAMAEVVAILITASAANVNNVVIGGASSPVDLLTGLMSIKPGGFFAIAAPDAAGLFTVTADGTDDLQVANSSSGSSVTYSIMIIGRSA